MSQWVRQELDVDVQDIFYKIRSVLLPFASMGMQRERIRDSPGGICYWDIN